MNTKKIIVKTESSNVWWGIYGLCDKAGWEDLQLFYESDERICVVCLNTKGYLRNALDDLLHQEDEKDFSEAVQHYLSDEVCHYWFYYDEPDDEDFQEVDYDAPKNEKGIKPRFMDIWHPDEGIDLKTIETAVSSFAKDFLGIENCIVEVVHEESLEESIKSFKIHQESLGEGNVYIRFSNELVLELSERWKMGKKEVLEKLNSSI
ncbi:hypothetical protein EG346_16150 [Chryseobacterium carnipullorum]|uniref:Uncharacterized protein n=1 Tax=Chryseobacterium carnipullorum TaxID=1124835 RepID=A0A1M7L1Y3_CHRCU|nr:hypothetical protein [Chryseobacterium carnipullorum]AZA49616.1 hypothetical protein EG346_16150 [Chryseobacterium carnipullorum]AZA64510.1 hypothetical protein EG345_07160 [Chryseobacterium carnipullorum]SHM71821.1 hypothetical protein SAMN05444360_11665 [Chryseobacterium carnipullorum]